MIINLTNPFTCSLFKPTVTRVSLKITELMGKLLKKYPIVNIMYVTKVDTSPLYSSLLTIIT